MTYKKRLFTIKRKNIKVTIDLGFVGEDLKLDGYDIGTLVSEIWGDSDYEYMITVSAVELPKLYELNQVILGEKKKLITTLAKSFSLNEAFSKFEEYLQKNNIAFTSFTYS
jgi:hypothetical protein